MALPTSPGARTARTPKEKFRLLQQAHAHAPARSLPRITTRAARAPAPAPESRRSSESSLVESSSEGGRASPGRPRNAEAEPAAIALGSRPAPAADAGSKAEAIRFMNLEAALLGIFFAELPALFSVPDPATGHLIQFGQTVVTLESASPRQVANLLLCVFICRNEGEEARTHACARHLLSLGARSGWQTMKMTICCRTWYAR